MATNETIEQLEARHERAKADMSKGGSGDCKDCDARAETLYGVHREAPANRCFGCAYSLRRPS